MDQTENSDQMDSMSHSKKEALLNKFLSKTYHMIDQCDSSVASWTTDGESFIIRDVEEFAKTVLPRYFKHSKFQSFVRQLNFYSFRKLRLDPSNVIRKESSSSKSVLFAHEYFRRGQPELLHLIQRITKSLGASSIEIRSLKEDIAEVSEHLSSLSSRLDHRLKSMTSAVESDYQQRMTNIALYYQKLSSMAMALSTANDTCTGRPPLITPPTTRSDDIKSPASPRSAMSPLETLSGVAAMICNHTDKADQTC